MLLFSKYLSRRVAQCQQELLNTHYAEVSNMYAQMRGFRHNYKNHLQALQAYAQAGDLKALTQYLQALSGELLSLEPTVRTGNQMADAILNSKIALAKSRRIKVQATAEIPYALKTRDIDLCVLLGSLFDNAIEACEQLPESERLIRLYMDMKNTQLYISLTNLTAQKKQAKIGRLFASTKGSGRGLGLIQMDAIVEQAGGYISRNSEDGAFTTEILLPQTDVSSPAQPLSSPKRKKQQNL